MVVVDLKLILFLCFLALALSFWLGWVISRRRALFNEAQLAIWQTFPLGFILLAASGHVQFANSSAKRLLQVEDALETTAVYAHLLQKLERDTAVQHFPLTLPTETTLEVWIGSFAAYRLILLRDVSQQRQRELDLHLYWSSVSHELRTPLTSILSHLEISRSENVPADVQQHSLNIAWQQTKRLNTLIYSTLELGRLRAAAQLDKIPVDMVLVAEEAVAELILRAEAEAIGLDFHFTPPIPLVLGNPDKLKQVLINVLDNALKYSQPGGLVTVSLEAVTEGVQCQIVDTGEGIPAQHLPRLTQQFYRARRDVPGSGLGLAIVDEIVRQHNGRLHIESISEGTQTGTTITFTLPIIPKSAAKQE